MRFAIWALSAVLSVAGLSCSFHPVLDTEKYWPCQPDAKCNDGCSCIDGQVCVPDDDSADADCSWCPEGLADCNKDVSDLCEVELRTDPDNCGACDNRCDLGLVCDQGRCSGDCSGNLVNCEGSCVDLDSDPKNCGECLNACGQWHACCEGSCLQVKYDEQNCGGCGVQCPAEQVCDHMECRECGPLEGYCQGECIDFSSSADHCGECGRACADDQACESGNCVTVCPPGKILCQQTCVDPDTDPAHCGGCERVCNSPPDPVCDDTGENAIIYESQGECRNGQCHYPSHTEPCPGGCQNGVCLGDPCEGMVCPEYEECLAGECVCTTSLDQLPCLDNETCCADGCFDLANDPRNCGQCGNSCGPNSVCEASTCGCLPGYGNCDTDWTTGCEEFLYDNPVHCGECANSCETLPPPDCFDATTLNVYTESICEETSCSYFANQVPCRDGSVCSQGTCHCGSATGPVCADGQTCCESNCVNIQSDPLHCGGCFRECVSDLSCLYGQCGKPGVECANDAICSDVEGEVCCTNGTDTSSCTTANSCDTGLVECDGPEDCLDGQVCCLSAMTTHLTQCQSDDLCLANNGTVLCTANWQCQELDPQMACCPHSVFGLSFFTCSYACK